MQMQYCIYYYLVHAVFFVFYNKRFFKLIKFT